MHKSVHKERKVTMNKKIVRLCLISCVMTLLLSFAAVSVGAQELKNKELFECDTFFDAKEYKAVLEAIHGSVSVEMGRINKSYADAGTAYKVYYSEYAFPPALVEGISMKELFSSSYGWHTNTTDGKTIYTNRKDNQWVHGGYSEPFDPEVTSVIQFDAVDAALTELIEEKGATDIELQCLDSYEYCGNYLFIFTSVGEYVIPFSDRPDFTGLESGELYTAKELGKILESNMPYTPSVSQEEPIYGGALRGNLKPYERAEEKEIESYLPYLVGGIVLLAVAITGFAVYRKSEKSSAV